MTDVCIDLHIEGHTVMNYLAQSCLYFTAKACVNTHTPPSPFNKFLACYCWQNEFCCRTNKTEIK